MKRFIVALIIMIGVVFVGYNGYSTIESTYNHIPNKTCVYVLNNDFELIRFANCNEDIPVYMLRQMDLLCEIDSVKYYRID